MNTLNFFVTLDTTTNDSGPGPCGGNANLDCRGADADQPLEFPRQREKLLAALSGLNGDIIGLNELENTPTASPDWIAKVRRFRADIEAHMAEEETNLFPMLRATLSERAVEPPLLRRLRRRRRARPRRIPSREPQRSRPQNSRCSREFWR
jgi:hypothetical protein